ncbi:ribosome small subunit-dependent GTPase A [Steroidobacter sp.]|uniref:ribosome small subunit-dependent GTPase A n=1 Tax=Steroidobacter sp. TaxID=1978227 RepID=UPI001A4B348A|nr:ribosome small subunit-dependent GTPase A [Steroidobacter sp.]MBL8271436.1 ribosome small subunit-dependent GTPase A [Steroidobacter sp.]
MSSSAFSLARLGWRPFHSQQLTLQDLETAHPARVTGVHRNGLVVISEQGTTTVTLAPRLLETLELPITVGDWVLIENDAPRVQRAIAPYSVIKRQAAGTDHRVQTIAANLDTLFVVTSCNDDFNPSRLERYLAVAFEAQVEPVIVITKADLCDSPEPYIEQANALGTSAAVVAVNAIEESTAEKLSQWLQPGQTVAFVGSSGVGKSTLVNTLIGKSAQDTSGIRQDDSKGRHTTTSREMFALDDGTWVIDTPGMRELKIGAVDAGLRTVFDNIEALAAQCHFRDCRHEAETGCAVIAAIEAGELDSRRLASYQKLQREAALAGMSNRERRARDRHFGRMTNSAMRIKEKYKR